ncbi:hypothetical protein DH09_05945 [Bacillaceae bacterium JMAK1]|nr:hypothetical protein DH09_05945 [Bacillaceae bacterium JMAK1]
MDFKKKLKRMQPHLEAREVTEAPVKTEETHPEFTQTKAWEAFDSKVVHLEEGIVVHRMRRYRLNDVFKGHVMLQQTFDQWRAKGASLHPLAPDQATLPTDLLFFDTETTGLSHGAGNMIFMIGTGRIVDQEVVVDQYFLPGPEHELAFYTYFLQQVHNLDALVTYNGKAFDWPQVKTRHTLLREQLPKLPEFGHFDLLHAARRLFKHDLESCRLSQVEQDILNLRRTEDTPGYLAPMLYQDYMTENDPDYVKGVFEHNEQDIVSLFQLYVELSDRVISGGFSSGEQYEVARWWKHLGYVDEAIHRFREIINDENEFYRLSLFELASLLKKSGQVTESQSLFLQLLESDEDVVHTEAAEAIVIHYEHELRDYQAALALCDRVLCTNDLVEREREKWLHRSQRLVRKIENTNG